MRTPLPHVVALVGMLAGCVGGAGDAEDDETVFLDNEGKADGTPRPVSIKRISSQFQLPVAVPSGGYQIHDIDVGTGLSMLIRGAGFTLLFDGGSGDDKAGISTNGKRNRNRLVAYLFGALGPSGPAACAPDGDPFDRKDRPRLKIDHVVLSHSHDDHVSLLADVLRCYEVGNVWEPGAVADTATYEELVRQIAAQPKIAYHTAAAVPLDRTVRLHSGPLVMGPNVTWTRFVDYAADRQTYALNKSGSASFKILHADGTNYPDANQNSVVMRIDLGNVALLAVGDAESGARKLPMSEPGDVEKYLLDTYPDLIDVDIHQAGHHGSMTSNRDAFLRAVSPTLVLIGVGPKHYDAVVLPDQEVIDEYTRILGGVVATTAGQPGGPSAAHEGATADPVPGTPLPPKARNAKIIRTDQSEQYVVGAAADGFQPNYVAPGCKDAAGKPIDRIGFDDDHPGGCDNYIIQIPR